MSIKEYVEHLKKADKAYINEQLLRIVQEDSTYAIDLNTSQLLSGIDSKGKKLKTYRNKEYAAFKDNINPLPGFGTPDLKLTGSFQANMYLQFKASVGWPVSFYSTDSKTQKLVDQYGKSIFGLTQDNLKNFQQHVLPKVKKLFASIFKI